MLTPPRPSYPKTLPYIIAIASGAAALGHELLWTRRLIDLIGVSTESGARVFACFFLGLALGSAFATRLAAKATHPWRSVAHIELTIALLCIPALTLPSWTSWIWPVLGPERLVSITGAITKTIISLLVIIPPAFMMGTTLPLMATALLNGNKTLSRHGTWLYAANTFGGVIGLVAIPTIVLPIFGVTGSMITAIALNIFVAFAAFSLDRHKALPIRESQPVHGDIHTQSRIPIMALVVAFTSGACILSVEILSLHLFAQVAPTAIYGPAAILAGVILMLAVAAAVTPIVTKLSSAPNHLLPPILGAAAITTTTAPLMFMWVTDNLIAITPSQSVPLFVLKIFSYVLLAIGPCILVGGMVLPMVFAWVSTTADPYGRRWGWILAVNGLGGLVGAEITQRVLMYAFAMHLSLGVVGLAYAVTAIAMIMKNLGRSAFTGPAWRYAGLAVVIVAISVGWLIKLRLIHPAPNSQIHYKVLWMQAGPEGVVAVTDSNYTGRGIVMFNQYLLGSTNAIQDEQRQAHLPIMLHPNPKSVAFIGLATGITAGAATMHDNIESITAIELSPLVAEASEQYFSEYNHALAHNPRANVVIEDGRTYIAACKNKFDLVIGDLFLPWRSGVGRLYAIEHFQSVRRSLKPGGMFCQMLPMYQVTPELYDTIQATLLKVFPNAHLFRLKFESLNPVLAIVATTDSDIDWGGLHNRCKQLRDRGIIRDPSIRYPESIAMLYIGKPIPNEQPNIPINTLNNTHVELYSGQRFITGRHYPKDCMISQQWIDFESCHADTITSETDDSFNVTAFADLGRRMTQWDLAARNKEQDVVKTAIQIRSELPDTLINDSHVDPSAWDGWIYLLNNLSKR